MSLDDLCWRAEEACLNAWPSIRTVLVGPWLVRASGGPTRRINSVNPLRASLYDPSGVLPEARSLFASLGQPVIFRVPTLATGLDEALTRHGFGPPEAETVTVHAALGGTPGPDRPVTLSRRPTLAWLAARAQFAGADAAAQASYARVVSLLPGPVTFASCELDGEIGAVAYGVISRGLLVLESVATRPDARRLGLGRAVVAGLMQWAQAEGAEAACLQVMADNSPARALYDGLGFGQELYRYHYRRE